MAAKRYVVTIEADATDSAVTSPQSHQPGRVSPERLAERTRTLDQIKRLYAVVMGFAVTLGFTNIYKALVVSEYDPFIFSIVVGDGIVLTSLIALFYLGAERTLDKRYLAPDSEPASAWGLSLDLLAIGMTSIIFVIMAEAIEPLEPATDRSIGNLRKITADGQGHFSSVLIGLYIVDFFLIGIQTFRMFRRDSGHTDKDKMTYVGWFIINAVSLAVVWFIANYVDQLKSINLFRLRLNEASACLVVFHFGRFWYDFLFYLSFYYPGARGFFESPEP